MNKDSNNQKGSENHFGLINSKGEAKYALWDMVDNGVFKGLTRNGKPITKTCNGNETALFDDMLPLHAGNWKGNLIENKD